jgi:hypothetical protein
MISSDYELNLVDHGGILDVTAPFLQAVLTCQTIGA